MKTNKIIYESFIFFALILIVLLSFTLPFANSYLMTSWKNCEYFVTLSGLLFCPTIFNYIRIIIKKRDIKLTFLATFLLLLNFAAILCAIITFLTKTDIRINMPSYVIFFFAAGFTGLFNICFATYFYFPIIKFILNKIKRKK